MPSDSEEVPDIPIVCEECGTRSTIPFPDVAEAVERHNEQLHDGADVATVDPDVMDRLNDLLAADMGLLDE